MEIYKIPIEFAIIVFPFVAFILTIPFLIFQYRKYGAIPVVKSLVFYSFILYIITSYFMVILPLPSMKYVSQLETDTMQLIPFQFIKDIMETIPSNINTLEEFIKIFNVSTVYIVIFNFFLTLPYGVYLRYYFNKKWYQTIILTFILSLFFELTQLSGLYGIYPRPYRLFDVDDLIINTLGGLFGHIITPFFMLFLPTNQELESQSYTKGKNVTILRRVIAVLIDIIFISIISIIIKILLFYTTLTKYSNLISVLLYYIFVPILFSGQTIGKNIVKLKIVGNETKEKWYNIVLRNIIVVLFILYPYTIIDAMNYIKVNEIVITIYKLITSLFIITNIIYYIFISKKDNKIFLYEKITNTKNISTIIIEDNCEEKL